MVSISRSLRVRLQLWHALILLCVVLSFGSLLYHQVVTTRWDEVDSGLLAAGRVLEGALRNLPRSQLDSLAQDIGAPRGGHPLSPPGPQPNFQPGIRPGPPPEPRPHQAALVPRGNAQLEWDSTNDPSSLDSAWEHGMALPKRMPEQLADPAGPAYYIIWRSDGSIVRQQDVPYSDPVRPAIEQLRRQSRLVHNRGSGPLREVFVRGPNETLICVGRPVGGELHRQGALAIQLLLAGATILGAGLCGGWWLSRSAVEPIERMTLTAAVVDASNLSARIDLTNIDRELEQLGQVLNDMLGRLQQSFETQQRFAADASHELRTPLATILSTIELSLSKPRQPEEYQQQLLKCQRAATRMHELVASLLQLTRSDAGGIAPPTVPVQLDKLVAETIDLLREQADKRAVVIESQLEPVQVFGQPGELAQVVTNLVQNAFTYNQSGGTVSVRLIREPDAAILSVRDTGIGIDAADLPHIFERFYRVDESRGQTSGHGLGLAICQAIVQNHSGSIGVTSQPGQGSEFVVRLPLWETSDGGTEDRTG